MLHLEKAKKEEFLEQPLMAERKKIVQEIWEREFKKRCLQEKFDAEHASESSLQLKLYKTLFCNIPITVI